MYKGRYGERDVLLVQTGIGKKRVERATDLVLERYPVTAMISLGFAGALTEESKVGGIVLCCALYRGDEQAHEPLDSGSPRYSNANLVSLAAQTLEGSGARWVQGSSVTMPGLVAEPKAKGALGKAFSAKAVDMESYWIARKASARQIPFLAVRAVSDGVQDALPPLGRFMEPSGRWRWGRATLYFLTHPQQLVKLLRLYRNARQGRKSLTAFVDGFIARV